MSLFPGQVLTASGTLAALNAKLDLDCPSTASAVIAVTGTFAGTLTVTGSNDLQAANGTYGGRLLFKSGVGCLGVNAITSDGSVAIANEYRVVTGGQTLRVAMTGYTSGSVSVKITASSDPSVLFINGPTHSSEEEAVRNGRAYNVSTSLIAVAANNFLNLSLVNPAGSGRNIFLTERNFLQSSANVLSYTGRSNPGALTGGTAVTPSNRRNDVSNPSVAAFAYATSTTALATGTAGAANLIATGGIESTVDVLRMLAPGTSMGYAIGGTGGGLTAAGSIAVNLVWYEEAVN